MVHSRIMPVSTNLPSMLIQAVPILSGLHKTRYGRKRRLAEMKASGGVWKKMGV